MTLETIGAPREDLLRATPDVEGRVWQLRAGAGSGDAPQLFGHFAVFDTWTEINSMWEGRFMERFTPGAFRKTIRDSGDAMRLLFQHGMDPEIGDRPIAAISDLREDDVGAYYEAELLDGVPDLITAGLRAGQYGASFRFSVMREEWVEEPGASDDNPDGLPERTVKEARVMEFGPVTFGAYPTATAGLRSVTDSFLILRDANPDQRRRLLPHLPGPVPDTQSVTDCAIEPEPPDDCARGDEDVAKRSDAPSSTDAAPERTSEPERRVTVSTHTGPLTLPTSNPQVGLTLTTERKANQWPIP